jgi:DNA replication protein DnaC
MDINEAIRQLREEGAPILENAPRIKVPNIENVFHPWMKYILGRTGTVYQPLPIYDEVIDYLKDNHAKGLLLAGACGTGKTVIVKYLLPIIFKYMRLHLSCFDAVDLIKRPDEVLACRFVAVDDIGTETNSHFDFGNVRTPADELFDSLEKKGKLGFFTTNLDAAGLKKKYGIRSYDRMIQTLHVITFSGQSFRRAKK